MADQYGSGEQDPRRGSQQNNTYHYTYSYGSGRGTGSSGSPKPPKGSGDWSEWVGIGLLLLCEKFAERRALSVNVNTL